MIPGRCREDTCHDHEPKADHLTHQEKVHLDGEVILFEATALEDSTWAYPTDAVLKLLENELTVRHVGAVSKKFQVPQTGE